jgi:hypothetical protein
LTYSGFLFSRDVLASPLNVPNGGQLTMSITLVSGSFSAINAAAPAWTVNIGDSFGGGIFLGWTSVWVNSPAGSGFGFMNGHNKYALVLSPKTGGEGSARALLTTNSWTTPSPNDQWYGKTSSDILLGFGASSPVGQFCAAANASSLGGQTDWYIPSFSELGIIAARLASIPAGEQPTSSLHWSSSNNGSASGGMAYNPINSVSNNGVSYTSNNLVRLVRRVTMP